MSLMYEQDASSGLVPSARSLENLRLLSMPEPGTDQLSFMTWDTIEVRGMGQDTIQLEGHYIIERLAPTSSDWASASVDIIMRELDVVGHSETFGELRASVNTEIGKQSRGQVRPGTIYPDRYDSPKLCVMEGFMKFELPELGVTLFNKEAIVLRHSITHIPPIGQGGGTGDVAVPLYSVDNPDGEPVATLRRVKTHIGAWEA